MLARACASCDMHTCGNQECGSALREVQFSSDTLGAIKPKLPTDASEFFLFVFLYRSTTFSLSLLLTTAYRYSTDLKIAVDTHQRVCE